MKVWFILIAMIVVLPGCLFKKDDPEPTSREPDSTSEDSEEDDEETAETYKIRVTWTANRETDVNKSGGGYRVYYSKTSGFSTGSATSVNVPYSSGSSAPTQATISGLSAGTWYMKVIAYSSYGTSSESTQTSVTVP